MSNGYKNTDSAGDERMSGIKVTLSQDEADTLAEMAAKELRTAEQQAAYLVAEGVRKYREKPLRPAQSASIGAASALSIKYGNGCWVFLFDDDEDKAEE